MRVQVVDASSCGASEIEANVEGIGLHHLAEQAFSEGDLGHQVRAFHG
jgi:hypothetical protein